MWAIVGLQQLRTLLYPLSRYYLNTYPKVIYTSEINIGLEGIKMASQDKVEPVPQPQQPQYPMYGPPYQPQHKQAIEYIRPFASDVILAIAIIVGLFFLMLGSVIYGTWDTSGGRDAGMIIKALGLFITTVMIILIGFWGSFWGLTVDLSIPGYT
jgi:hypothetical protein